MPRRPTSQKAFTLIEVLMAATVLVVGFTAVIQAVTVGAEMIDTARKQQIAQQIIDGEIAARRNSDWFPNIIPSVSVTIAADGSGVDDPGTTESDPLYFYFTRNNWYEAVSGPIVDDPNLALRLAARGFTIARALSPPSRAATFRSITYTVSWTGISGRKHSRIGVAYFGKNGLHLSYQK